MLLRPELTQDLAYPLAGDLSRRTVDTQGETILVPPSHGVLTTEAGHQSSAESAKDGIQRGIALSFADVIGFVDGDEGERNIIPLPCGQSHEPVHGPLCGHTIFGAGQRVGVAEAVDQPSSLQMAPQSKSVLERGQALTEVVVCTSENRFFEVRVLPITNDDDWKSMPAWMTSD